MSLGSTILEKTVEYAIENPERALSLGRSAMGHLESADGAPSTMDWMSFAKGAGVGLVVGLVVAAWMSSSAKDGDKK